MLGEVGTGTGLRVLLCIYAIWGMQFTICTSQSNSGPTAHEQPRKKYVIQCNSLSECVRNVMPHPLGGEPSWRGWKGSWWGRCPASPAPAVSGPPRTVGPPLPRDRGWRPGPPTGRAQPTRPPTETEGCVPLMGLCHEKHNFFEGPKSQIRTLYICADSF